LAALVLGRRGARDSERDSERAGQDASVAENLAVTE